MYIHHSRSRLFLLFAIMALVSGACQVLTGPTQQVLPAVTATPRPTIVPSAVPTLPPLPTLTPVVTPIAAVSETVKGPFQKFLPEMGLPSGGLRGLWADPQGTVWLASDSGVYAGQEGFWKFLLDVPAVQFLGSDTLGRVWVLLDEGRKVAFYDGLRWKQFTEADGWKKVAPVEYLSPGFSTRLSTDNKDRVWFATGRNDLRSYESKTGTWQNYTASDLKYQDVNQLDYQGHFLTSTAVSKMGKVWVGDCVGEGENLTGQGVRRLDDQIWNIAPPTARECVMDMAVGSDGKIWIGAFDRVLTYSPDTGDWQEYPLPTGRHALVTQIQLDRQDIPWVEVARAGGASQYGTLQRYHWKDPEWVLDLEISPFSSSSLAFDQDGQGWICAAGQMTLIGIAGVPLEYGQLAAADCRVVIDATNKGWVLASGGEDAGLWFFTP